LATLSNLFTMLCVRPSLGGPAHRDLREEPVANFLDDDLITLECDHCGYATEAKVRILRQNQTVTCLACGVSLEYNAAEFRQSARTEERPGGTSRRPLS